MFAGTLYVCVPVGLLRAVSFIDPDIPAELEILPAFERYISRFGAAEVLRLEICIVCLFHSWTNFTLPEVPTWTV
jgi:hypothetical protein